MEESHLRSRYMKMGWNTVGWNSSSVQRALMKNDSMKCNEGGSEEEKVEGN